MAVSEAQSAGAEWNMARGDGGRMAEEQDRRNLLAVLYGGLQTLARPAGELDERARGQVTAVTLEATERVGRILLQVEKGGDGPTSPEARAGSSGGADVRLEAPAPIGARASLA